MSNDQDYPYVRAYGRAMGSFQYWIDMQVAEAREDNAPENATHRNADGTWSTTDDVINPTVRKMLGLEPLPEIPVPEFVNHLPVVNWVELPYRRGFRRGRYMVLCFADGDSYPWIVWHVAWNGSGWDAEHGDYLSDPRSALQRMTQRAVRWGADQ